MVLLDDLRVLHGVTPIRPEDSARPALRDVLVVTFRQEIGRQEIATTAAI